MTCHRRPAFTAGHLIAALLAMAVVVGFVSAIASAFH